MNTKDRSFHSLYATLLVCCIFIDPLLSSLFGSAWHPLRLSIYPVAAALIWLATWIRRRLQDEEGRRKALEERIKRLERRISDLEVERAPDPRWPG